MGQTFKVVFVFCSLLVFGVVYAIRIAIKPFPIGKTWKSVVLGDLVTDAGSGTILWILLKPVVDNRLVRLCLCLVPVFSHAMTGGPMIAGQVIVDREDQQHAVNVRAK